MKMGFRFDEKGKIFTDVITKEPIPAIIQMPGYQIRGVVHVRTDERLKDELNKPEEFMAVTDAIIYGVDGVEAARGDFIAVNRSHILWVVPESDAPGAAEEAEAGE